MVLISDEEQIEKFRDEINSLGGDFSRFVSYMRVGRVLEVSENLINLKEILQDVGLIEEVG
ncbi:MAG: hypothetical protein ACOC5D_02805 [Thermoplasmatota archaeon]